MLGSALLPLVCAAAFAAQPAAPDWAKVEEETLRHFQALVRLDTTNPPGNEIRAVEYVRQVLEKEGIAVRIYSTDPQRPNLVARLKGSGARRPILIMGHTDTVTIDPKKWVEHGPFSADRANGFIYGRGTVDDKDNLTASMMTMVLLKRLNVPLDRDVIFLAEAGEEVGTRFGIQFMTEQHWDEIDAEICLAEGGGVVSRGGKVRFASVQTAEKIPYGFRLIAHGPAGHGSRPLRTNAIVHVAQAVARVAAWQTPMRLNDTTRYYFERLATVSSPEEAARYNNVANPDRSAAIQEYFADKEPGHYSMLRTSVSPNLLRGGYQINVIPSEAEAVLDVRALPDENMEAFFAELRKVVNDPAVEIVRENRNLRPGAPPSRLDSEAFRAIEAAAAKQYPGSITLPSMSTGATDMAYLRARGIECYGIGPAVDEEEGPKGFGAHSDQERIRETSLHSFVRYNWDIVTALAGQR